MNTAPRIALVTGATRGIGLETVRQLAAAGVHTLLAGRDRDRAFLSSFPNLVVQICFSEFVQSIRGLRQSDSIWIQESCINFEF